MTDTDTRGERERLDRIESMALDILESPSVGGHLGFSIERPEAAAVQLRVARLSTLTDPPSPQKLCAQCAQPMENVVVAFCASCPDAAISERAAEMVDALRWGTVPPNVKVYENVPTATADEVRRMFPAPSPEGSGTEGRENYACDALVDGATCNAPATHTDGHGLYYCGEHCQPSVDRTLTTQPEAGERT